MREKNNKFNLILLITVMVMDLLAGMEFDLFVPSFPEIQHHFVLSAFWVEAALSVNFVGYCIGLFCAGDLADRYGRKPIILLGLSLFIAGSIFCLLTPLYGMFLVGRFLQGIGVAAPAMLSFLIIADMYSVKKQQFLLTILNGVMNISVAIAPVIGSYVTKYFHWQGNFSALLFLGVLTFILTTIFVPVNKLTKTREAFSVRSYFTILQTKKLRLLIICLTFMYVPYWVFVGMSPLLYMKSLGVSLTHFGYYQGSLALVFAIGCIASSLFIEKYQQKNMLLVSNFILILGMVCVMAAALMNMRNPLILTLAFIPFTLGHLLPSNLLYPVTLNLMPQAKGRITAILQSGRLVLASISLQVAGFLYDGTFRNIGMIISFFIGLTICFLFIVLRFLFSPHKNINQE